MAETMFEELKRYVRFGPADEARLRALATRAAPHFRAIAEEFYQRITEHEKARRVFSGPAQIERLKGTLCDWMRLLFTGPWDEAYFEKRARIGRIHVKIGLEQRYMFSAMNLIRIALQRIAQESLAADPEAERETVRAIAKIVDLELAIMLETYREAFVAHELALHAQRAERLASLGIMAAGLAHEIRNPLNAASLQLTVVKRRLSRENGADVAGAREAAGLVASEMTRLAGLVEEFLQFARPQPLRLARVELRATAAEVCRLERPAAKGAGVTLTLADGPDVSAQLDDERIRQVLLNLIRNGVEATGQGGHVTLRVASVPGGARFEVEDDGPGLPSPEAPIFEPFFTTKASGTGLGLSIVHRIVGDHGGWVEVDSRPGRTVFSVTLPAT